MNKMESAIAEGFVAFYYWKKDHPRFHDSFNAIASKIRDVDMRLWRDEGRYYVSIFGQKFEMNDDFFLDYGVLVENETDARNMAEAWKKERDSVHTIYVHEVQPLLPTVSKSHHGKTFSKPHVGEMHLPPWFLHSESYEDKYDDGYDEPDDWMT